MSSFSIQVKPRLNLALHLFYAHSPRAQHGERNTNPADSPHFTFMTLVLPENLKLCFPGKSVFPFVQVDYLISSSPTSNASSPILGKLVIFFSTSLKMRSIPSPSHTPPPHQIYKPQYRLILTSLFVLDGLSTPPLWLFPPHRVYCFNCLFFVLYQFSPLCGSCPLG